MKTRISPMTVALVVLVGSLLLSGFATSFDRTLIEMPAWHELGAQAWAAFSRRADLGNGELIYSIEGIGGTLLILIAAVSFSLGKKKPLSVAIPLYAAVLMRACVLLVTTQAAPFMLSLRTLGDDPAKLQQAFDGFYHWDSIRAVFVALGHVAIIWAVVAMLLASRRSVDENP